MFRRRRCATRSATITAIWRIARCSLDIGAKTSNLLFFEKGKVYSRSINLGANSITQDFANEAKLKFAEAEKIKIDEGFVSLGGAYEEPENPHQAAISKIARQFMTRLHIQVNQTMQFYRGQQGGSAPQRLFLSGGASIMPYTAQFFAEKLNVPVEYFNPFRNVQIDPSVNLEELARVAHSLGEVVGSGIAESGALPGGIESDAGEHAALAEFNQKKPYLICHRLQPGGGGGSDGLAAAEAGGREGPGTRGECVPGLEPKRQKAADFQRAYSQRNAALAQLDQVTAWMEDRYYWANVCAELRRVFIRTEDITQNKLKTDTGVWIEQFLTMAPRTGAMPERPGGGGPMGGTEHGRGGPATMDDSAAPTMVQGGPSDQISTITLLCRAVNLQNLVSDGNTPIIYTLESQLKASPLFDEKGTQLQGSIYVDEPSGTFTFGVVVTLKHPMKL